MVIFNEWLVFSLILLGIWFVIWLLRQETRREMFKVSIYTMPFGLTEPLFVPEYWNPPSLFNLAARTGFDIESLIFCFAVGGIGSVLYEFLIKSRHTKMSKHEMHASRHQYHRLALFSPILFFLMFEVLTSWNSIYTASIAMFCGAVAALVCRQDLKKKIWVGGVSFLILYFIFFLGINLLYPTFVNEVWNLKALSGILLLGVPLEELLFACAFGMMWSSIYEHVSWIKLGDAKNES